MTTQEYFDTVASSWDSQVEVWPEKIAHILDVAALKPGHKVLDVGSGTGVLLPYLAERIGLEGHATAVDISPKMLQVAKAKYGWLSGVDFCQRDIERDEIKGPYDAIVLYCVYPHLQEPLATLQRLSEALAPEGHIIIAHPESRQAINAIAAHREGKVYSTPLPAASVLRQRMEAEGLKVDYWEDDDQYYIIRLSR